MFFNADRHTKEGLLHYLKKERDDQERRKLDEKTKRVDEERQMIDNMRRVQDEDIAKKQIEKMKRINDSMNEYHQIINKKELERKNFTKFHDVNINNYATRQQAPAKENIVPASNEMRSNYQEYEYAMRNQKLEQQHMYKNYLDLQVMFINLVESEND
jgi:hypothetical protein